MSRKPMGEGAAGLFARGTAADALREVASDVPLQPDREQPPARPAPVPAGPARFVVTTVRIEAEQWGALRQAALERATAQGGKADASAVLREVLDAWMRKAQAR
jgi:hypothetical protein